MEKVKVLYIAHKPPFPAIDGGCVAMKQFIKQLSVFELDALIMTTEKHPFVPAEEGSFHTYFKQWELFAISTKVQPFPLIWNALFGTSYHLKRFESAALKKTVLSKEADYDYIVCDSLYAAVSLRSFAELQHKVIIRTHNCEFRIWETLAEQSKGLKKQLLKRLAQQLKVEEIAVLKQAKSVLSITNEESVYWKKLGILQANYFPVAISLPEEVIPIGNTCFFLGAMNWKPNSEAVDFLVNQLWTEPKLAHLKLELAGSYSEQKKWSETITGHGKVENANAFMMKNGILVAPIFTGSGVKIKILEALALGCVVISTTLGAEGISISDAGLVIAETKQQFQTAILELTSNERLRRECSEKGKQYIREHHHAEFWQQQLKKLFVG